MQRLDEGLVEGAIDGERRALFREQRWRFRGEHPLHAVRTTLSGGPTLPPVVLVHGFAQNRYTWDCTHRSMAKGLAERGFDVWNLELRGHGLSRTAVGRGAEGFADYVEDVAGVARRLGGGCFLVGHSLGGTACYAAATEVPVAGVVGLAALYGFGGANPVLGALCRLTCALAGGRIEGRAAVRTRAAGRLIARLYGLSDTLGYWFPLSGWWPGSIEPELLRERLVHGFDWTSVKVWQEMSRWGSTGAFDYDRAWRATDVPLLVVAGDEDHLMPPADARLACERSGSSDRTMVVMDDYEHEVHWGHLDLVLGSAAPRHTWPLVWGWMERRAAARPAP